MAQSLGLVPACSWSSGAADRLDGIGWCCCNVCVAPGACQAMRRRYMPGKKQVR